MVANVETPAAPASRVAPPFGRPRTSLLAIFDRQRRQSLVWFAVAVAAWVWAAWDHHHLVEQFTHRRDVLLIDSLGTYYVSPVVDVQQAKDLHAMQTKLACKALFERNPAGLDNPELLKQLFLRDAAKQAQTAINNTKAEFEAKLDHHTGRVVLPDAHVTLNVPDGFYFLDKEDTRAVLEDAWSNPPDSTVAGMLFPNSGGPFAEHSWGAVLTFEDTGYVSDEDANGIDYDMLIDTMR